MPLLFSHESLELKAKTLDRMAALIIELRAINLERQLRIAEADIETGEGNDPGN